MRSDWGAIAGGAFATVAGLVAVAASAATRQWAGIPIGLLFVGTGFVAALRHPPFHGWVKSRWPRVADLATPVFGLSCAAAAGLYFIFLALFSKDESDMPAGRGPVLLAGLAFLLAPLLIVLQGVLRRAGGRRLGQLLAICLVTALGGIPVVLALRGEMHPAVLLGALVGGSLLLALWGWFAWVLVSPYGRPLGSVAVVLCTGLVAALLFLLARAR